MHHAMPGRDQAVIWKLALHPTQKRGERILMGGAFRQILVGQGCSRISLCDEMHAMSNAIELAVADKSLWSRPYVTLEK